MERKYNFHLQYGEKFTTHLETLNSRPNWICYSCDQCYKTCFGESQFPQKQNIWKKFDLRQKSAVVSMHKYTWQLLISYNCWFLSTVYFLQRWFLTTVDFLQLLISYNVDFLQRWFLTTLISYNCWFFPYGYSCCFSWGGNPNLGDLLPPPKK